MSERAPIELTLVRHGESTFNVTGQWQGQGDAPLSPLGEQQALRVGARLARETFDRVVSSDLQRAHRTALATGHPVETREEWREIDVGRWEGLTRAEVAQRYPDEVDGAMRGDDVKIGGAESWSDLSARVERAMLTLLREVEPGARVCVVAHDGVIASLVSGVLGLREHRPRPIGRISNTAISRLAVQLDPTGQALAHARLLDGGGAKTGAAEQIAIDDLGRRHASLDVAEVRDELELVSEACKPFELDAFREGHLTPVYFGSALRNFGVGDLLEGLGRFAPSPRAQASNRRKVAADEPKMSAFVFKIQANMDPNHRDRIAFARLCSGKLTRGMKAKLVRTGKPMPLSSPQFFFAQDRAIADEAFAGDVVGIPNHGSLRIGDTLTEGEDITFVGVPSFAPEIIRRVRLTDAMKAKKLREALQQMSEEGVVQVFRPRDGAPALVGVVGMLQLDVLKARLDAEYSLPVDFEVSEFQLARWISSDDRKALDAFVAANGSGVADDVDGDPVFLARNQFYLDYTRERSEGIAFSNVKDVKKSAA